MTSIVFHGPSNKRKKRINSARLFDFGSYSISGVTNRILAGAFRDNIRNFLQSFGKIEDYTVCRMTVWCTALVSETDGILPLYVMEETVENSLNPFCEHCELTGWGHHFVCKRRYHFIIPVKENWNLPLDEYFEEIHSHKLYGLIHCNGYGHLLGINGLKMNSKLSAADDCMVLWDRLCTVLKVRSISAGNTRRKETVDWNLIHGAAYGKSWLEKWGYRIIHDESKYIATVGFVGSLSLDKIIIDSKKKKMSQRIQETIDMYREMSDEPLASMSELLKFMLARNIYKCGMRTFVNSMTSDCRWSAKRLEHVVFVIIDLLKANSGAGGMSRQELRDEARKTIGDTGLIDFVLKSIKCLAVDDVVIRRSVNPLSKLTEFAVHEISNRELMDVQFIYENVVQGYLGGNPNELMFMKEWAVMGSQLPMAMTLTCKVLPDFEEMETELTRPLSPGEVVVVEPWITIGELRMVAQCALRDTYCVMDRFEVGQIGGLRKVDDERVLSNNLEPGSLVWVRGHGLDLRTRLRYQDGRI